MRALVLAQGGIDARWMVHGRPFLGVPKHLLVVDGEPILGRTIRQLRERGVTDIIVTAPADDPRYRFPGAQVVEQDQSGWDWPGLNVVQGTRDLWSTTGRTTVMFGDVFHTDAAMDLITSCREPEVHFYRRPTKSALTGHPWDEPFALSFLPEHHQHLHDTAARLAAAWRGPKRLHLWKLFAALQGVDARDAKACRALPGQTPINDWTDDIDKPTQATAWLGRYYAGKVGLRVVISWRDTGCRHRRDAFGFVREAWEATGAQVVVSTDDGGGHFNVSQARNRGARGEWEVCLFADADTLVTQDQAWAGAYLAQRSGQVVLPYETHHRLDSASTRRTLRRRHLPGAGGRAVRNHVSSAVLVPRSAWEHVRFDERFVGWGAEDRAYYAACVALLGEHDRLPGDSVHLWHPNSPDRSASKDDPRRAANLALGARYKSAAGVLDRTGWLPQIGPGGRQEADTEALRALLAEPGGPMHRRDVAA